MTIEELNQKFIDRHYIIDDKLLWWTYTKIDQLQNKKRDQITALGLFGKTGCGKTTYVNVYKDILNSILGTNIELITFACNYEKEASIVNDDSIPSNVIEKSTLIDAINKANKGLKVILFIDGYDEVNQSTDKFLANFLENGYIINNNEVIKLNSKDNLQLIIAGNNSIDIFETLQRRLDIMKLSNLNSFQILKYLNYEVPFYDNLIKYFIMHLYSSLLHSKDIPLPAPSEVLLIVKNAEFLIDSFAPFPVIYDMILDAMLKYVKNVEGIKNVYKINSLFDLEKWDKDKITNILIKTLDKNNPFHLLLFNKLEPMNNKKQELPVVNEVKESIVERNKFSLMDALQEKISVISTSDPQIRFKVRHDNPRHYDKRSWGYNKLLGDEESHKWFKIAQLEGVKFNSSFWTKKYPIIKEGLILSSFAYPNDQMYFNGLIISCDKILNNDYYNLSIYTSEPLVDSIIVHQLNNFFNLIAYSSCDLSFALISNSEIKDEKFLSMVRRDPNFPTIYYYKRTYENKNIFRSTFYGISEFSEILTYLETPESYFIIPTNYYSDRDCKFLRNEFELKLGKIKLQVNKYGFLNLWNQNLMKLINSKVETIYNDYKIKRNDEIPNYSSDSLFYLNQKNNFSNQTTLTKGVNIVKQGSAEEFLLIHPFEAFVNLNQYKINLYDWKAPFVKELMQWHTR